MPESIQELKQRLATSIVPGFRERLLDRGLARGLIWRDGVLPGGAPPFVDTLTDDLLDYAYTVLALALRLRAENAQSEELNRAFVVAGEAIEAAVHRGDSERPDRGFNRVSAAVAFHLARYAARAYSVLPNALERENLAPAEAAIVQLLRRSLDDLHGRVASWLLDGAHTDAAIAQRLEADEEFDESDAINVVLTSSVMRGLALFDYALVVGAEPSAADARRRLFAAADAAKDLHCVSHWWTATLAADLIDDLWKVSFHKQLPTLPPEETGAEEWNLLRWAYIHRLRVGRRSVVDLWPSQLEAACRALDLDDDLVVALPTSAGKTRIAEFCILRTLASGKRIVYVTPLRALSAQIERDLAVTFLPLGFSVSSLYGSAGIESGDAETLAEGSIVVATPEKLDFALRNAPSLVDDVGLVVLDEGHMLGPNEREVRYEALVQRLLRRPDAKARRVVCLSALFPTPEEMSDLVAWIRQDEPGEPVHAKWRPTRQRFGVLTWLSGTARLDVKLEEKNDQSPYVERYITPTAPPDTSARSKNFPADKNELTLAAAWNFIGQKKDVLVYCALRTSVETLGKLVLKCIRHEVLKPLVLPNERIKQAMSVGAEWLGLDHPAVQCLEYGVALHHGGLPRPYLNEVEWLLRSGDCRLTIASPTLAQGLNLSASVLLVPSIWRNREIIPVAEFANVAGRAGRAFVDVEGLVLHVIWEKKATQRQTESATRWATHNWDVLVSHAKAPSVKSGLLLLAAILFDRIALASDLAIDEVMSYVTGQTDRWNFSPVMEKLPEDDDGNVQEGVLDQLLGAARPKTLNANQWEAYVASLDAALLALLEAGTEASAVADSVEAALQGSLFSRQIAHQEAQLQTYLKQFIVARANLLWSQTTPAQRKGYHFAGVGLTAGQFLDAHLNTLVELVLSAEAGVAEGNAPKLAVAVVEFARLVFQIAPFRPTQELPDTWEDALREWVSGAKASKVVATGGEDSVDLLQDAFTYRLPWAMEATRVHATAAGHEWAELLEGLGAIAVEVGSANRSVITLLRAGLASREAASAAVTETSATFDDRAGMKVWLRSDQVQQLSLKVDWPTAESRHSWLQFLEAERAIGRKKWQIVKQTVFAEWDDAVPSDGADVVVEPSVEGNGGTILTPDLYRMGTYRGRLQKERKFVVVARVASKSRGLEIDYFGPTK